MGCAQSAQQSFFFCHVTLLLSLLRLRNENFNPSFSALQIPLHNRRMGNDAFEVTTGNTVKVKEYVIAVIRQVLENRQRPRSISASITDKDRFLNLFHICTNEFVKRYE